MGTPVTPGYTMVGIPLIYPGGVYTQHVPLSHTQGGIYGGLYPVIPAQKPLRKVENPGKNP